MKPPFPPLPVPQTGSSASYHNQKPNSSYLNFGNLTGPISLNDPTGTEVFGKKDSNTATSFTVGHFRQWFLLRHRTASGLSINSALV
jgi:hypothetical protein